MGYGVDFMLKEANAGENVGVDNDRRTTPTKRKKEFDRFCDSSIRTTRDISLIGRLTCMSEPCTSNSRRSFKCVRGGAHASVQILQG